MKVRMIDWEKKKKRKQMIEIKNGYFFFQLKEIKKNETVHKFTNEKQKKNKKHLVNFILCPPNPAF